MENFPKNSPEKTSFSEKLKEKTKTALSSVSKMGRRTFLAGAFTTATLGVSAQQAPVANTEKDSNSIEQSALLQLKEEAQTKPFNVLNIIGTLDSTEQKEVAPIMEEALMKQDPMALLYFFSDNKNNQFVYNPAIITRVFDAAMQNLNSNADNLAAPLLVNAGLLKEHPKGDIIFQKILEKVKPSMLVDEEYRHEYLKYPNAAELAKPFVKRVIDDYVKNGYWSSIGPALSSFIHEPWANDVLNKWAAHSLEYVTPFGDILMSTSDGQKLITQVLEKKPATVQDLSLSKDSLSPELQASITKSIEYLSDNRYTEEINSTQLLEHISIFETIPGGDSLAKKIALITAVEYPSVVLDHISLKDLDWIGENSKKELIQSIVSATDPFHVLKYARLFSAEPYARKIIEEAASHGFSKNIISYAGELLPREKYIDLIQNAVNDVVESDPSFLLLNSAALGLSTTNNAEYKALLEKTVLNTSHQKKGELVLAKEYGKFAYLDSAPKILEEALLNRPIAVGWASPEAFAELEKNTNPYIQKLVSLVASDFVKKEINYFERGSVYAALQYLTDNDIIPDKTFLEPDNLFAAYIYAKQSPHPVGLNAIDDHLVTIANSFVNKINRLHDEADSVRFASVENYQPEVLYTLATYGEQEAFTSTFNGLFNRIIKGLESKQKNGYAFLEEMSFMEGRTFIRECASYNRLNEFLNTMPKEDQRKLLDWFISGITNEQEVMSEGVVIADVISSVEDKSILDVFGASINRKYIEGVGSKNRSMELAYGLLASLYAQQTGNTDTAFNQEGSKYHIEQLRELPNDVLFGPNKTSVHRYYFYNDSDGQGSFESFMGQYKNDPNWHVEDKKEYVVVSSTAGKKVVIYANKPDAEENSSIDSLLTAKQMPINVVVHRGHSFHAQKTVNQIPTTAALISLGSCGGYRLLDGVLTHSPNAHVISTKGTGTMKVNDPILKTISDEIRSGHSLKWSDLWVKFEEELGGNPNFGNYVPPNKNLGLLFMNAYRKLNQK